MASSLLDELPCLLDEADELMARVAYFISLAPARRGASATATTTAPASTQTNSSKHSPRDDTTDSELIRACLDASESESALKFFARQFQTALPVPVEKMLALLQLPSPSSGTHDGAATTTLQAVSKQMYHLMKRVHHWQRAAWGVLTQFFAEASYLTFDKHRLLATLLLNTLTKYVKVHLLWTSCNAIPSLLAVHTFTQSVSSSSTAARTGDVLGALDPGTTMYSLLEHVDHHLREYVLCFGSNPLVKIQQDFQTHPDSGEIARNLSALALSCFESFIGCHDLAQLRNQGVFDAETFAHGAYAALGVYDDLLYSRAQEDWVLCTALCLPQQLRAAPRLNSSSHAGVAATAPSSVQLWDFVHVIAQDRLVWPVYRGVVVNIHSLLYQQIVAMLSASATTTAPGAGATSTSSNSMLGLSTAASSSSSGAHASLKKLMSALSKHALRTCAEQHLQRAQLVAWLLQSSIRLLTQTPALVAPLFPVLLAACETARSEIEWRLCHDYQSAQVLLPTHVKPKHVQRARAAFASGAATRALGDLLASAHTLRSLMHAHLDAVERYYDEFLAHGDADAIVYEIHELLGAAATDIADVPDARTHQILSSFAVKERYCVVARNGHRASPWRREWRQLTIALLADRSASAQLPAPLIKLMERACVHSKYVEFAGELLAHHAQLAKWWWFAPLIEKRFNQLLATPSGYGASAAIAMLDIVDATLTGRYPLDEVVEDAEVRDAIAAVQTLYERMETAVGTALEQAIDAVVGCEVALHDLNAHLQTPASTTRTGSMDGTSSTRHAKTERSLRQESRLAASSATLKSSESRLPSAIASLRSGTSKPKRSANRAADSNRTRSSGPLCDLIEADETLSALIAAIYARASNRQSTYATTRRLAALVARHVRACLVRFLRGLLTLSSDITSVSSSTAAATVRTRLRCGLEHAGIELQCYTTCIQQLFRSAAFVDLSSVVLETLASECHTSTSTVDKWESAPVSTLRESNCLERLTWFYLAMIDRACTAPASGLIASMRERGFTSLSNGAVGSGVSASSSLVQQRDQGHVRPEQYASPHALSSLRAVLGGDGMRELSASVMRSASNHVQTLRSLLEQDRIPLIWFGKCVDAPYTEAVLAVWQMQRLDDITRTLARIGLLLFLSELLRDVEPSIVSLEDDPQWQSALNAEHGAICGDEANGSIADEARVMSRRALWQLLPVAFAASFHSELWRRSAYIEALDAADTNAHMSAVAVLHLLPLACESSESALASTLPPAVMPKSSRSETEDGSTRADATTAAASPLRCVLVQRMVILGSQAVLGLRGASSELPSSAMLASLRTFAELASVTPLCRSHSRSTTDKGERCQHDELSRRMALGVLAEVLPDVLFQSARIG